MRTLFIGLLALLGTGCQMLYADNPDYDALAQPITADEGGLLADGRCASVYTHVEMHRTEPNQGYSVIVDVWRDGPGLGGAVTYLDDDGAERVFEIQGWRVEAGNDPGYYWAYITLLEGGAVAGEGRFAVTRDRVASIDLAVHRKSSVRMFEGRAIVPLDGDEEAYLRSDAPSCL